MQDGSRKRLVATHKLTDQLGWAHPSKTLAKIANVLQCPPL
jgi:hypothetical protein